mgnify:CR=1 FL=1
MESLSLHVVQVGDVDGAPFLTLGGGFGSTRLAASCFRELPLFDGTQHAIDAIDAYAAALDEGRGNAGKHGLIAIGRNEDVVRLEVA